MDAVRFDHLTRILGRAGGRRAVLGACSAWRSAAPPPRPRQGSGKGRGKGKSKDRDRDRGRDDQDRLRAEGRGRGGKQRKGKGKKKKRGGTGGGNQPPPSPPPDGCCGTESCPDPEPGSTSSGCDFAGRNFAGQDHNGSLFRGIDGRGRRTSPPPTTRARSSPRPACRGRASAAPSLDGSTWGDACLFGADFTGADLGGDLTLFDNALFCGTVMPDGSVNDRDCDRGHRLLPSGAGRRRACQSAGRLRRPACQTKACTNGQCAYTVVADGSSPNGLCAGHCCEGDCCPAGATECNPQRAVLRPQLRRPRSAAPTGAAATAPAEPAPPARPATRRAGSALGNCRPAELPQRLLRGRRGLPARNHRPELRQRRPSCRGCSGQETLPERAVRRLLAGVPTGPTLQRQRPLRLRRESCPNGCCDANDACQPGGARGACGTGGRACQNCQQLGNDCVAGDCVCTAQSCPGGCCDEGPGEPGRCFPNQAPNCGVGGALCVTCSGNNTCNAQGQCVCAPNCAGKTCGPDGCGGSCGTCRPGETCTGERAVPMHRHELPERPAMLRRPLRAAERQRLLPVQRLLLGQLLQLRLRRPSGHVRRRRLRWALQRLRRRERAAATRPRSTADEACCGPPAIVCNDDDGGLQQPLRLPRQPLLPGRPVLRRRRAATEPAAARRASAATASASASPRPAPSWAARAARPRTGAAARWSAARARSGTPQAAPETASVPVAQTVCPASACLNLANGDSVCCLNFPIDCGGGCSSNANCPGGQNAVCLTSFTTGSGVTPPERDHDDREHLWRGRASDLQLLGGMLTAEEAVRAAREERTVNDDVVEVLRRSQTAPGTRRGLVRGGWPRSDSDGWLVPQPTRRHSPAVPARGLS